MKEKFTEDDARIASPRALGRKTVTVKKYAWNGCRPCTKAAGVAARAMTHDVCA